MPKDKAKTKELDTLEETFNVGAVKLYLLELEDMCEALENLHVVFKSRNLLDLANGVILAKSQLLMIRGAMGLWNVSPKV